MAPACRQQISTASDFRRRGETRSRGSAVVRDPGRRGRVLIHSGVASAHPDHLGKISASNLAQPNPCGSCNLRARHDAFGGTRHCCRGRRDRQPGNNLDAGFPFYSLVPRWVKTGPKRGADLESASPDNADIDQPLLIFIHSYSGMYPSSEGCIAGRRSVGANVARRSTSEVISIGARMCIISKY
jgi:hypothetical protein